MNDKIRFLFIFWHIPWASDIYVYKIIWLLSSWSLIFPLIVITVSSGYLSMLLSLAFVVVDFILTFV